MSIFRFCDPVTVIVFPDLLIQVFYFSILEIVLVNLMKLSKIY
jgi:hypothetical protein